MHFYVKPHDNHQHKHSYPHFTDEDIGVLTGSPTSAGSTRTWNEVCHMPGVEQKRPGKSTTLGVKLQTGVCGCFWGPCSFMEGSSTDAAPQKHRHQFPNHPLSRHRKSFRLAVVQGCEHTERLGWGMCLSYPAPAQVAGPQRSRSQPGRPGGQLGPEHALGPTRPPEPTGPF